MARRIQTLISTLALAGLLGAPFAQAEDDVLARIKPVAQVNVAKAASAAKPAAAPAASAATSAPAPAAPAATEQASSMASKGAEAVASAAQAAGSKVKSVAAAAGAAASAAGAAVASAAGAAAGGDMPGKALYTAKGCAGCHGADGKTTVMPVYPKIAGQSATYLLNQMKDIKSGTRANGQSAVMKGVIAGVSEEEMKAIAEWLATLAP